MVLLAQKSPGAREEHAGATETPRRSHRYCIGGSPGDKPIPPAFAKAVKIFNELAHDYNLAT